MSFSRLFILLVMLSSVARAERMSWLENEKIKLGVDLDLGGAITFLADAKDGQNLINNHDYGRQVQLSFYSGPVPFEADGQKPSDHWYHLGWNPIQTGDCFGNPGKILTHRNDGKSIHLTSKPLQWPLNNIAGDCTFDSWLELDGTVVKARARLTNKRSDHTQYPARLQELPAVYANAAFPRVMTYSGSRPFTDDDVSLVPRSTTKHPWSFWIGTEGWSALLNDQNYGLGLITPGCIHFTGGFVGKPGPNDPRGNSTGYIAGQGMDILDHDIVYQYQYELVVGSLNDIRTRAAHWKRRVLPEWSFTQERQGWHYRNATDTGWPIKSCLHVKLDQNDPQLVSPHVFWQAAEAPYLVIEAAFHTTQKRASVMWQAHGEADFSKDRLTTFPIIADDEYHRYVIHLGAIPTYQGGLIRLRFDPVNQGESESWVKVRNVKLQVAAD